MKVFFTALLIMVSLLLTTGCHSADTAEKETINSALVKEGEIGNVTFCHDAETGVQYFFTYHGMTVRINQDGTPKIHQDYINNNLNVNNNINNNVNNQNVNNNQ